MATMPTGVSYTRLKRDFWCNEQVALSGPITPETVLQLPGKGMPIPEQPGKAGNLCVRFRIAFPSAVTPVQKGQLQAVLQ